jgi:hypothetical protein
MIVAARCVFAEHRAAAPAQSQAAVAGILEISADAPREDTHRVSAP